MTYDAAIIGAGPAGIAAASLLHARGLATLLIGLPGKTGKTGKNVSLPDWITNEAVDLLGDCGLDCRDVLGEPFTGITFHSGDLKKTAESAAHDAPAHRVDYAALVRRLVQSATDAGASVIDNATVSDIDLGDKRVTIAFDRREPVETSFLLLADGAGRTFATVGPGRPPPVVLPIPTDAAGRWFATLELPVDKGHAAKSRDSKSRDSNGRDSKGAKAAVDANMHWLLDLDRQQSNLTWWFAGAGAVINLLAYGTGEAVAHALCDTLGRLAEAGLLPLGKLPSPAEVALRPAPTRSALEIESHVEKRCLLIGDAGGFVSETSGEGIYPAVWSARLAAETIAAANESTHPQDELRSFSTAWRSTMADFLRPPNTDLHFLVPLIFGNQQMADRMASAFWKGASI